MVKRGDANRIQGIAPRGKRGGPRRFWRALGALCLAAALCFPAATHAGDVSGAPDSTDDASSNDFASSGAPAGQGGLRIEQVQAELPALRAWVYADAVPGADDLALTLGGRPLEVLEARPVDPAKDATAWYFLVDCSTSTTTDQMAAVQAVLNDFSARMGPNDTVSLITFGTRVDTLLAHERDPAALADAARALVPDQPGTLFFDALAACAGLSGTGAPLQREVAFVFSDSVDYNLGGYTRAEVDTLLAESNLPVYAFGFDTGSKEQLDTFGALARASGGAIAVVGAQSLPAVFDEQLGIIQSAVLIAAQSENNVINSPISLLAVQTGGRAAEAEVALSHWKPDTTAPTVTKAEQLTAESIRLTFSEPVEGAGTPSAYEIIRADGDLVGVSAAAYSEADGTVLLTLSPAPSGGPLRILCPRVYDISMEHNPVAGEATLDFEAAAEEVPEPAPEPQADSPFGLWLLLTLAGVAVIAGIAVAVVKKRNGAAAKDGKQPAAGAPGATVVEQELTPAPAPGARVHFAQGQRPPREVTLKVSAAGGAARTVRVPMDKTLFAGRGDVCDVMFDDAAMSRQHFVIGEENGLFTLTNLSETGGTRLNGVPVQKPRPLHPGDVIEAGNTKIIFGLPS